MYLRSTLPKPANGGTNDDSGFFPLQTEKNPHDGLPQAFSCGSVLTYCKLIGM